MAREFADRKRLRLKLQSAWDAYGKAHHELTTGIPEALIDAGTTEVLNELWARKEQARTEWESSEWVPFRHGTLVQGTDENGRPVSGNAMSVYTAGRDMKGRVCQAIRTSEGCTWGMKSNLTADESGTFQDG